MTSTDRTTSQEKATIGLIAAGLLLTLKAISLGTEPSASVVPSLCTFAVALFVLWSSFSGRPPRWLHGVGVFLAIAMSAFVGMTLHVNHELAKDAQGREPFSGLRIWSTRGLTTGGPEIRSDGDQNTIEAVLAAFEHGALGVEVDVFYDAELADFVVSHDRPYNKKNGALLMLSELLESTGHRGAIWLDWKKLRHLEDAQLAAALEALDRYTAADGLKERFYIEGEDPFHLSVCRDAGFPTIYDTHPLPDAHPFSSVVIDFYKAVYHYGGFTVLSAETGTADDRVYGPKARLALKSIPLFLYHAPWDEPYLETVVEDPNVQVVILRDHSLDRFQWPEVRDE